MDVLDDEFNDATTLISQQKAIVEMNENYGRGAGYFDKDGNGKSKNDERHHRLSILEK